MARRVDEIINSGTLKNVKNISQVNKDKNKTIKLFESITGVGLKRAEEWYKMKYKTITDIKKAIKNKKIKSTHHINIGLKYYDDFKKRIPRKEMDNINKIISKIVKKTDKDLKYKMCGSYRRKLPTSGDIDIIITNPKIKDKIHNKKYLSKFVKKATECGFIIDNLTNLGEKKYMGVCRLGKIARRIDIRCFNSYEYITALIYFTGSRNFNIYLRNTALKQGYMLNEYYLMKKTGKKKIYLKYEKELFEILGIKYVNPKDRNI